MFQIRAAAMMVAIAGLTGSVLADGRITMSDANPANSPYNGTNGSGGAFIATRATPLANGDYNGVYGGNRVQNDGRSTSSFLTFCLERNETFSFGTTYYTEIATSAANGGNSGGSPDPLSATTAKLYTEFRSLADSASLTVSTAGKFNNILGSTLSADETSAIQMAIWYSEGEMTLTEIGGTGSTAYALWNWANTTNDGTIGNVRVMRLWDTWSQAGGYSGFHQDQLTMIDQLTTIPLPPAAYAGLGSLACVAGAGIIRRRKLTQM